jgi:hypothetical protein
VRDSTSNEFGKSGVNTPTCHTCGLRYIGQTDSDLNTRYKEQCRHIKTNKSKSAYALHILNNKYEY